MPSAKPARPYAVRNSAIHGRGVFAVQPIRKGTRVIEYKGERVSWKNALKRPDSDPDNPFHTFFFSLDDGHVIDAGVGGNAARWINHSCGPNCETKEDEGRVFIYAKKDIVPGDELTYDYSLTVDGRLSAEERAWFACRCGKRQCRGTMLNAKRKSRKR